MIQERHQDKEAELSKVHESMRVLQGDYERATDQIKAARLDMDKALNDRK